MVSRHQVTGEVVDESRILICLKDISSSWVMMIRLRAWPASGDFSNSLSRSSAAIRVLVSGERVEDKHWINSSSAMVWLKDVETRQTRRDLGLLSSKIHQTSSLAHKTNKRLHLRVYLCYTGRSVRTTGSAPSSPANERDNQPSAKISSCFPPCFGTVRC